MEKMNPPKTLKVPDSRFESQGRVRFRRWSKKKWAVLATFHKVILIGTLCFSYNLVAQETEGVRIDTNRVGIHLELEEVEAVADSPFQLENTSLKPLVIVTRQDIAAAPAGSIDDILEYLPQVDIRNRGKFGTQADLSIQGGSFDQSLVLLNGLNVSDPQTGHFHLNLPVELSAIHHAELVAGSASRRFGTHAFSGAVNLVTLPYDSSGFNSGFTYGQHNYYRAYLNTNVSGKYVSTMTSIGTSGSDGYRENTDFRSTNIFFHSSASPGNLHADLMMGLNTRAFGANAFYTPRFARQYEETTTGLTGIKVSLKKRHSEFTMNGYFRVNKDYFVLDRNDPSFYRNDHMTRVAGTGLEGRFSTRAGITHSALQFRRESILSTSLGEPVEPVASMAGGDEITYTHGHARNHLHWNINQNLEKGWFSLDGGILLHMNSDLEFKPYVLPGLDIRFILPHSITIFTSVNRSMRLPTFTDLYYQGPTNVGNPALLPERATTYELGAAWQGAVFRAAVNGFYRQGRELIDWVWMEDEKWHTMNLTEVDALGGDLRVDYSPGTMAGDPLALEKLSFSYTFTRLTRVSDEVISRYLLDNLRHKVVMATRFTLVRNLSLSVILNFQDRNGSFLKYDPATGNSTQQPYDPFLLVDTKITYSFGRFHLFLEANNLMGVEYYDLGNVVQPGRWSMVGIEIR